MNVRTLLLAPLVSLAACAGGSQSGPALAAIQAPAAMVEELAPLERALSAVDAGHIQADVEFLADDALAGRDSPSTGLRVAARYLVGRMQRLGWEPGSADGWLYTYPLASKRVDPALTRLELGEEGAARTLELTLDYGLHYADARSGRWEGPLVYAGEGRERELDAVDLTGRWAVCSDQRYGRRRRLRDAVLERGGLGLVMLPRDDGRDAPFERWASLSRRDRPSFPDPDAPKPMPSVWFGPNVFELPVDVELGSELGARLALEIGGGGRIPMENVAALWRGHDPRLADEVIVISAHYDHVGIDDEGRVMNGADDNASGTAGLLALAEALCAYGPLQRSVLLLWVSAEELGLYGSRAWAQDPRLPEGLRAVCNINMDMIGRNAPEFFEATPSPEHEAFNELSRAVIRNIEHEGFEGPDWVDRDWNRSDQASFAKYLEIPVVYVSCGEHDDYHQHTDTAEKIDSDKIGRVIRVVLRVLDELQGSSFD